MQRLTERGYDYSDHYSKQIVCERTTKLQQYEDDEEDGKLLRLPCKPGDTVWVAYSRDKYVYPFEVRPTVIESFSQIVKYMEKGKFGTRIWTTPEAANLGVAELNRKIPYTKELPLDAHVITYMKAVEAAKC